uniref:DUF3730 domain-containing protein n=1 Tax=Ananas comosus var. bracteatus TaxID=296719 RepID=A0A6V7QJ95_ANACO|nr:unnamed protein product [Ananas comosus var. bracteatus]
MTSSSSSSDPYAHLLERTRVPTHPSLHRHAIASLFHKLRSAPPHLSLSSAPGAAALSAAAAASSAAAADQFVRELCRLVRDRLLPASAALVELHSALDGADPRFAPLFVRGVGFLARLAFRSDPSYGRRFDRAELHPFVRALASGAAAERELVRQVLVFVVENRSAGIEEILGFLRPFVLFSVIRKPPSSFARDLISSMASLVCSFPAEAIPFLKLLTDSLKYFPRNSREEVGYLLSSAEYLVDAYVMVFKQMAQTEKLTTNAQVSMFELLKTLLSLCSDQRKPEGVTDTSLQLSKRLLAVQKETGLQYLPEFGMVFVSISIILSQVEFEHEQLAGLKLLILLTDWKYVDDVGIKESAGRLGEELLCVFPVISLMMSPSKSIKSAAAHFLSTVERLILGLLAAPSRKQIANAGVSSISTPESILFRVLEHQYSEQLPFQNCYFLEFLICNSQFGPKGECGKMKNWTSQLKEHLSNPGRRKHALISQSPDNMQSGFSMLLSSVASVLLMHAKFGASALESLAALGATDPKLGLPLLLLILTYIKMLSSHDINTSEMLIRLLEALPSLALHSIMVPFMLQTVSPMLQMEAKPVLRSIAVRLLCKIWVATDGTFANLQEVLDPKTFSEFIPEREVSISMAASVRDVCKHNPDRGVDLILSVSSCIESRDSVVQALGLDSLSHLCEADVVDFYTSLNIILKHLLDYSNDPIVAHSLCTLLRWGALDAEAYSEASKKVLEILWGVATSKKPTSEHSWVKARAAAFNSLSHYKVMLLQDAIPDFKIRNFECLTNEDHPEILEAMEGLEVEIVKSEHICNSDLHVDSEIGVECLKKRGSRCTRLKSCWMFFLRLCFLQDLPRVHAAYEKVLVEIAESLHTSRNILVALFAFQSWKSFVRCWMRAVVTLVDPKGSSDVSDKSTKVAQDIFKIICRIAAESIPRVAVNIAFVIGALCMAVPPTAHLVVSAASDFLLKWLFEYEHEHRQWSAAISLGLISNCFHPTDKKQKFNVINGLLKVICSSESHLVRGACGVGLGYACQDLLTRVESASDSSPEGTMRFDEAALLDNIVGTLSVLICQLCPSVSGPFRDLGESFPLDKYGINTSEGSLEDNDNLDLEEDAWGVAGLVYGLAHSVSASTRCIYSNPYPPLVHLAGMFGVVNAFGAGAGDLTNTCSQPINLQTNYEQEASFIRGPILACPACETLSTSLVQEIFLVSKDSKDQAMQNFAAWAISFLRNRLWPMESDGVNGSQSSSISQSFPEDALVLKLSLWLRDINSDKTGNRIHATTVATVLRCLSKAPRLPPLDWGAIIRRCMRYEAYFPNLSVEHIPMLRTLEPRLQSVVLENLSDLLKLFSGSRLEKLYEDLFEYFSSSTSSYLVYEPEQRSTLRMSIWKGLRKCLTEDFKGSDGFGNMERCMECLLSLLPISMSDSRQDGVEEEWSCAINCLGAAPHNWLVDKLQVPTSHVGGDSDEIGKRIVVKARLTRIGCISPSELGKLKAYIFNARSKGIWWSVLVEVAAALSTAEGSIKRQWLLDALEISCVADYPSTALRFIGLLSSACCMYMPLLTVDPMTVLSDLPVTLPSLLSDGSWAAIITSLVDKLWASTIRICSWAKQLAHKDGFPGLESDDQHIHKDEAEISVFLARVMHRTCISLKDYLPFEKQLRLANLEVH